MEAQTNIAAKPQRHSTECDATLCSYSEDEAAEAFELLREVVLRIEEYGRIDDRGDDDALLERISTLLHAPAPSSPIVEGAPS
ncbi:hypothetical protein [Hyphomicrobium sp. CS1BSMeth3]|uniref:hypothetical protein n=1 Tax=Hyphomicrobium sp. CS1BSMeth3 TaxID=1892844 RepID=UPI0009302A4A|nr:hypothetical protein [Hyphomicrobium sp. CS1BSMeth3]